MAYKSSVVRLVLQIMEGSNFQQLDKNSWLLFRGSVEGVSLATDKVPLSSMNGTRLEIGEELVWKMSYRNYQRIKSSKALKLECFNFVPGSGAANSIGYIIVHLKSVTDTRQHMLGWRKLLGCSYTDAKTSPQLLMSVALLDKEKFEKPEKDLALDKRVVEISGRPTEMSVRNGVTYVGAERFCKERFQFSCTLLNANNMNQLIKDDESISTKPFRLQLKLLGQVLYSASFDPNLSKIAFDQLFVFDVLSKTSTLRQFLSEHPSVDVSLMHSDSVVCQAKHFLGCLNLGVPTTATIFLFRDNMDSEMQPSVTLRLMVSDLEPDFATPAPVQKVATLETPSAPPPVLFEEDTEFEIVSEFSKLNDDLELSEPKEKIKTPREEIVPPLKLRAVTKTKSARSKEFNREPRESEWEAERMTKVVEELEDWKMKQKVLFAAELKTEKERLVEQWNAEMKVRQSALEFEQMSTIHKTKDLSAGLEKEIEKLKVKGADLQKEEEKLKRCAKILEDRLTEQSKTLTTQKEEYESKINILVYQNKQLHQKCDLLEAECTKLKKINKSNQSAEILELKEKLREMEMNMKRAEEVKASVAKEHAKVVQQTRNAAARETTATNNNKGNFQWELERARLLKDKVSLEKLKSNLLSMGQKPSNCESAAALKLQEQREAILKTGVYNEQSELVKTLDQAIQKARSECPSGDED